MAKRLTKAAVERIAAGLTRREIPDAACHGLYLVVQPSGKKSWAVRCRLRSGRSIKKTIGPWPAFGLEAARDEAEAAIREAKRGDDPRRERGVLVEDAIAEWLRRDQAKNKSAFEVERVVNTKVLDPSSRPCWRGRALGQTTRADCRELIEAVADRGAPTTSRRLHAHLHKFFRWCVGVGLLAANPIADMPKLGKEVSRDRVLTDAELGLIWRSAPDLGYPFGPAVQLLILTAARRDEIMSLRWSEVDVDAAEVRLPGERTKNGRPHVIPLSPLALDIVRSLPRLSVGGEDSSFVFTTTGRSRASGTSRAKARLDKMVAERSIAEAAERGGDPIRVEAWRIHDLRRTAATRMAELGVEPHVVEALLNHVSGFRAGVAGTYNRAAYAEPKRAAVEQWAHHVAPVNHVC